jgi:hypothetical protein
MDFLHQYKTCFASIQECYEPIQTHIPGILFSTFFNEPCTGAYDTKFCLVSNAFLFPYK